jgi:hypothetical protein
MTAPIVLISFPNGQVYCVPISEGTADAMDHVIASGGSADITPSGPVLVFWQDRDFGDERKGA